LTQWARLKARAFVVSARWQHTMSDAGVVDLFRRVNSSILQIEIMQKNFGIPQQRVAAGEPTRVINWRRGSFRLWFLASAAWVMGWLIYLLLESIQGGLRSARDLLSIAILLLGPPVALLIFGVAAGWAVRGFKGDD
jgi:hypothetical protein